MLKSKIAVMVSGGGTNLQAILNSVTSGIIKHGEVTLVVSNNRDAYALERAKKASINSFVTKDDDELLNLLKDADIDMLVLAGYLRILSKEFIASFGKPIINVHPSLIPSFCGKGCYGLHVHEKALGYGVKVTGATVHYVNEIPDGGEIIFQKAVEVLDGDTPEVLQKRVMEEAEWLILPKAVEKVAKEIYVEKNK